MDYHPNSYEEEFLTKCAQLGEEFAAADEVRRTAIKAELGAEFCHTLGLNRPEVARHNKAQLLSAKSFVIPLWGYVARHAGVGNHKLKLAEAVITYLVRQMEARVAEYDQQERAIEARRTVRRLMAGA